MRQQPRSITIQRTNYVPDCKPDEWLITVGKGDNTTHRTSHDHIDGALFMLKVIMEQQLDDERTWDDA